MYHLNDNRSHRSALFTMFMGLGLGLFSLQLVALESQEAITKKAHQYQIAYNVLTDAKKENYEIFVMDMDGSNPRNISRNDAVDWVYYSYGNTLYFLSDRNAGRREFYLYSMNANGEQVKKIADIRLKDSWFGSRFQGKQFIVNPHGKERPTFYIIDLDGKILKQIQPQLKFASDPIFTADGQQIIFRGARFADKKEPGFVDEIYLSDLDGKIIKQLSHYPGEDTSANWYDYNAGTPRLKPDDNTVTYQSFQKGKYSLFGASTSEDKLWQLTDYPENEGWHQWSPDGQWLAVELFDAKQTQFRIGLINWQSRQLKVLTKIDYQYQQAPVFVEAN